MWCYKDPFPPPTHLFNFSSRSWGTQRHRTGHHQILLKACFHWDSESTHKRRDVNRYNHFSQCNYSTQRRTLWVDNPSERGGRIYVQFTAFREWRRLWVDSESMWKQAFKKKKKKKKNRNGYTFRQPAHWGNKQHRLLVSAADRKHVLTDRRPHTGATSQQTDFAATCPQTAACSIFQQISEGHEKWTLF